MRIISATSAETETRRAIEHVFAQTSNVDLAKADFFAVHATETHDLGSICSKLKQDRSGHFHGGTSCQGVMGNTGFASSSGYGLGVFALFDPDGSYGTGISDLGDDPRKAARDAIIKALDAAGRPGESPDVVWLSTAAGSEEEVLRGLSDEVGTSVPVVGGTVADNAIQGNWHVFDETSTFANGVVVSVLFPSTELSIAYQSGYAPTEHKGTVTRADGRRIHEIDHRPAASVYSEWTDGQIPACQSGKSAMILSESTFTPLGREIGSVADVPFYLLAHPATVQEDLSIDLFADVEEGEILTQMQGSTESLVARAGRVAAFAASSGRIRTEDIAGALVIYCGGCMLAVEEHMNEVAAGVNTALDRAPFIGIFTFGEQGPILNGQNAHGNLMISCITFAK